MTDKDLRIEDIQKRSKKLSERIYDLHAYEENRIVWLTSLSFSLIYHFAEAPNGLESFDRIVKSMREQLLELTNERKKLNDVLQP